MQLGKDFKKVLKQIEEEKGLPEEVIVSSLEAAMISAYKKFKGGNQLMEVYMDAESGEFTLYEVRMIVDSIENPDSEITLEEAIKRGYTDITVGDVIRREVFPEDFGRIAAQTARQVIIQRLKDAERQVVYEQFADKIGNIVTGTIFKSEGDQILVRLADEAVRTQNRDARVFRLGQHVRPAVLDDRRKSDHIHLIGDERADSVDLLFLFLLRVFVHQLHARALGRLLHGLGIAKPPGALAAQLRKTQNDLRCVRGGRGPSRCPCRPAAESTPRRRRRPRRSLPRRPDRRTRPRSLIR